MVGFTKPLQEGNWSVVGRLMRDDIMHEWWQDPVGESMGGGRNTLLGPPEETASKQMLVHWLQSQGHNYMSLPEQVCCQQAASKQIDCMHRTQHSIQPANSAHVWCRPRGGGGAWVEQHVQCWQVA